MVPSEALMSGGHVLVIEDDEWVARLLAVGLREAGHRVTLCADGAGGITTIHREAPDCVVCDVELPDVDGYSIGRSMLRAGGRVAGTPLVYLCAREEDPDTRLEALRSGGDAYLSKPFRIDEVALTVTALIRLAERNRGLSLEAAPESASSAPPPPEVAPLRTPPPPDANDGVLEGDLAKVSVATILTVLEMEKHTGHLEMTNGELFAQLHLSSGHVDGAILGETPAEPIVVLRTVLTWTGGRFTFLPTKKAEKKMTGRATIGALLMEAARLEDESNAGLPGRENRRSSIPPMSARMSDMLGAAFGSTPPPPPTAEPPAGTPVPARVAISPRRSLLTPPTPPVATATPTAPAAAPAAPASERIAQIPPPSQPSTTNARPAGATAWPAVALRDSGPPAPPSTKPGSGPVPADSPAPTRPVTGPTRPVTAPGGIVKGPVKAAAGARPPTAPARPVTAPGGIAAAPATPAPPVAIPRPSASQDEPTIETSPLIDDDDWGEDDDEGPAAPAPVGQADGRKGPPPVPPPRPTTSPTPPDVKSALQAVQGGTDRQVGDKR